MGGVQMTDGPTSYFNAITAVTWLPFAGKEQQERFLRPHLHRDAVL